MKKDIKLYNVFFLSLLIFSPLALIISIILILLYITLVFFIVSNCSKLENHNIFFTSHLPKVLAFGLLSYILGIGVELLLYWFILSLHLKIANFGDWIFVTIPAVLTSTVLIYVFNRFVVFKNITRQQSKKISFAIAAATAPYILLIPTNWLISF